jgi:hypothetical protein
MADVMDDTKMNEQTGGNPNEDRSKGGKASSSQQEQDMNKLGQMEGNIANKDDSGTDK